MISIEMIVAQCTCKLLEILINLWLHATGKLRACIKSTNLANYRRAMFMHVLNFDLKCTPIYSYIQQPTKQINGLFD